MVCDSMRPSYHQLKAQGLCVQCGKAPALENKVMCAKCGELNRQRALAYLKRRYEARKAQRLCVVCGNAVALADELFCSKCFEKQHKRSDRWRAEQQEQVTPFIKIYDAEDSGK